MNDEQLSTEELLVQIMASSKGRFGLIGWTFLERLGQLGVEGRAAIQLAANKHGSPNYANGVEQISHLLPSND